MIIHTVRPGDSVYAIAGRYGVSASEIINANGLTEPFSLIVGESLVVPGPFFTHTVVSGDTMYSLARRYGVSLSSLLRANPEVGNGALIRPGQQIVVPAPQQKQGSIYVNGYAFPSISDSVLSRTLPYLTFLSIFSYQVAADGSLASINDVPLIEAARAAGVAPMMVITNLEEGAGFSSELASAILATEETQNALLDNVLEVMREKNYYGLDIDFEYVYPSDRENYNSFVRRASERLRPLGYSLSTALAPKISAAQPGLLYEAHDYPVHGQYADHVILMTYEWGYTYGPAMAVAPIDQVERVLDYAVTAIPPEKILMGMPNYGYDWTLPFVRGTAAQSLSNTAAVARALEVGAEIRFDATSQAPFFNYYGSDGRRHEVWFEDARSVQARLGLINEYGLGGVSYWTINSFFPQNWVVLSSMFDIVKLI